MSPIFSGTTPGNVSRPFLGGAADEKLNYSLSGLHLSGPFVHQLALPPTL
jgi:hypothetical protein